MASFPPVFTYCAIHKVWGWKGKEHVCEMIPELVKAEEDQVALFLNGGPCTKTVHEGASELQKLMMLKMLRLDMPHQSTSVTELDFAINRLTKEKK